MNYTELVNKAKDINESVINKSQELLEGCSDDEITTTLLMVSWSLKKSIETYVDEDKVNKIWEDFKGQLYMEKIQLKLIFYGG